MQKISLKSAKIYDYLINVNTIRHSNYSCTYLILLERLIALNKANRFFYLY